MRHPTLPTPSNDNPHAPARLLLARLAPLVLPALAAFALSAATLEAAARAITC